MKHEENEISALVAAAMELTSKEVLNSSEKLLGRIIVRTVMTIAQPDMLSDEELGTVHELTVKIDLTQQDLIRMAASIMADSLVKKIKDSGDDDMFAMIVNA